MTAPQADSGKRLVKNDCRVCCDRSVCWLKVLNGSDYDISSLSDEEGIWGDWTYEQHGDMPISKDFRGLSRDQQRFIEQQKKYWSFREVNRGQMGAPHYISDNIYHNVCKYCWSTFPADFSTLAVKNITKREFYNSAWHGSRPRRYHTSRDKRWPDEWEWTPKRSKRVDFKRELKSQIAYNKSAGNWRDEALADDIIGIDVSCDLYCDELFDERAEMVRDSPYFWHDDDEYEYDEYEEEEEYFDDTEEFAGELPWEEAVMKTELICCAVEGKEEQDWVLFDYGDDFSDCGSEFEVV